MTKAKVLDALDPAFHQNHRLKHDSKAPDSLRGLLVARAVTSPNQSVLTPFILSHLQNVAGNGAVAALVESQEQTASPARRAMAPPLATATTTLPEDVETETSAKRTVTETTHHVPGAGGAAVGGAVAPANPLRGSFETIPSGTLTPTIANGRLEKSFDMIGRFNQAGAAGEYRQYVSGSFTANGQPVTHPLGGGRNLHSTNVQEDGDFAAGTLYGYRASRSTQSTFSVPDQATGRVFTGRDTPGIGSATGTPLAINLNFRGDLIDTANGNAVLATQSWRVVGRGIAP